MMFKQEINIAMIGNVDAGKTSTTSVLINDTVDDGRGSARSKIFMFKHEKESGRSSTVSEHYMQTDDKIISFVDLAGHEKYLKTTLLGLNGYNIDYGLVLIAANMGITKMTKEHIGISIALHIPITFVITKIDICPPNIFKETMKNLKYLIKKLSGYKGYLIKTDQCVEKCLTFINSGNVNLCPIFTISNKTGKNIDKLKYYITHLQSRIIYNNDGVNSEPNVDAVDANSESNVDANSEQNNEVKEANDVVNDDEIKDNGVYNKNTIVSISRKYNIPGVGLVLSGRVIVGKVSKGDKLVIGPIGGKWHKVTVKSLHDNFRTNVDTLYASQGGCFAVKAKGTLFIKGKMRKGIILCKEESVAKNRFDAEIRVLSTHHTTISKNYQPVINCGKVVQTAKICEMKEDCLRSGQKSIVTFEFMHHPEYIKKGDTFIFREGSTRGVGIIKNVF